MEIESKPHSRWVVSKRALPYDVPCKLHYKYDRFVGKVEAHPMPEATRRNWIGYCNKFDGVLGISTNTRHHIGEYSVALEYDNDEVAKDIVSDVAAQMMWYAYPQQCYDNFYNTK